MGQYYIPMIERKGVYTVYDNKVKNTLTQEYDEHIPLKITEHSWWKNELVNGIAQNLYKRPGRLVWCGDYTDLEKHVSSDGTEVRYYMRKMYQVTDLEDDQRENLLEFCTDIRYRKEVTYNGTFTLDGKVIINLSKNIYLDCDDYFTRSVITSDEDDFLAGWCQHPLSLLTSSNREYMGGGDFRNNGQGASYVGSWAFDKIVIKDKTSKLPKDCTELKIAFNEYRTELVPGLE